MFQLGGPTDEKATDSTGSWSVTSLLKRIAGGLTGAGSDAPQVQGNVAHDAVDSGNPVEIGGYAADTAPTNVGIGDRVRAWFRRDGSLSMFMAWGLNKTDDSIACYPPGTAALVTSAALETGHILKASAGTLRSLMVYNNNAAVRYIHIFNLIAVPANSTVPSVVFAIPATSSKEFSNLDIPFTTGISIANSTAIASLTLGGADCWFTAVVI